MGMSGSSRVAILTGAGRGIGRAMTLGLLRVGIRVLAVDRDREPLDELAGIAAERQAGAGLETMQADLIHEPAIADILAATLKRFGRVDILVNNAGIARSDTPAEDVADEHWLNVLDVNLNGVFWCCRAFGREMLERGKGSIVNVGSMSGFIVNRPQPQSYYNASKAAVHHLTKSLAAEWGARGVRVNAVAPTYIDTPLNRFGMENPEMFKYWIEGTPMRRMGTVEEIGSVVLFLASDAASLLTGSIVLADGGYSCW
jgi:NAD(P)-dependent dehydrogenase (short-subunit alcohol dehydrogenase family)